MDGLMGGWMDGWVDGWVGGWVADKGVCETTKWLVDSGMKHQQILNFFQNEEVPTICLANYPSPVPGVHPNLVLDFCKIGGV
jgi:hypothetical protein